MSAPPVKVAPEQARPTLSVQHGSPLVGARFSPSGEYVLAGAQDNALVRWNPEKKAKDVLVGHKSWVRAMAFAGKTLFSGDWAGRLLAWDYAAAKPTPLWSKEAHRGWLRALAVSPDGKTLASCGNEKLVKLWSIPDG
jgi:WD40 repeat protein